MGLAIRGNKSKKSYSYSYGALHLVRELALLCCGMPKTIAGKPAGPQTRMFFFMPHEKYPTPEEMSSFIWAIQQSGYYFPNLMFHSDCDGNYTRRGKVLQSKELLTGNSVGLLRELDMIKIDLPDLYKTGFAWDAFNTLYDLVNDEVTNGTGRLELT